MQLKLQPYLLPWRASLFARQVHPYSIQVQERQEHFRPNRQGSQPLCRAIRFNVLTDAADGGAPIVIHGDAYSACRPYAVARLPRHGSLPWHSSRRCNRLASYEPQNPVWAGAPGRFPDSRSDFPAASIRVSHSRHTTLRCGDSAVLKPVLSAHREEMCDALASISCPGSREPAS